MKLRNAQIIGLLEERLRYLKVLGQAIQSAQQACIAADLEALRIQDGHKEQLCSEIRRLDLEICARVQEMNPAGSLRGILEADPVKQEGVDAITARRLRTLFDESEAARADVERLNLVYAQFLARSRSTLNVMINVFSHCLGVYPSLDTAASRTITFERST